MNNKKIINKVINYCSKNGIYKIIIIIFVIIIIIIVTLNIIKNNREITINNIRLKDEYGKVNVILSGAVKNPGNYYFELNATVEDAIDLAGGITENADISYINFKKILLNKEKIEIPLKQSIKEEIIENTIKININTADKNELKTLPGIGDVTAEKIIEYRNNKSFDDIEEIKEVPGIGESKYNSIKELITI